LLHGWFPCSKKPPALAGGRLRWSWLRVERARSRRFRNWRIRPIAAPAEEHQQGTQ